MKLLAIASFLLALTVPAFARIGETLDQTKQRYGAIEADETFSGLRRLEFEKNGFRVATFLLGNRVGAIIFVKSPTRKDRASDELSEIEIQNFLKANGAGKKWKQVGDRFWEAPGLSAMYTYTTNGPPDTWYWSLGIFTNKALDKMAAYEAAEQTRNQEGF